MNFRDSLMLIAAELRGAACEAGPAQGALPGKVIQLAQQMERLVLRLAAFDLAETWVSAGAPPLPPVGETSVAVLAVIDDAALQGEPFVDIATYWPEGKRWTVTYCCKGSEGAVDRPVRVLQWRPKPAFTVTRGMPCL